MLAARKVPPHGKMDTQGVVQSQQNAVTHYLANVFFFEQVNLTLDSCISRQLDFLVDSWVED